MRQPRKVGTQRTPNPVVALGTGFESSGILMNRVDADETVLPADRVHPIHTVRPIGCRGLKPKTET
jgi:hypothetical protein